MGNRNRGTGLEAKIIPGEAMGSGRGSYVPAFAKMLLHRGTDLVNCIPNLFKRGVRTKTDRSSAWAPHTIKDRSVLGEGGGKEIILSQSKARAVGLLLERPKTAYHLGNVAHEDFCETAGCLCPNIFRHVSNGSRTRKRIFPIFLAMLQAML